MNRDKHLINLIREQYEYRIYTTLLEMEVVGKGGKIILDAGIEVKNKDGKKFTVQSVQKDGDEVTISLISPENVTGPIISTNGMTQVSPGQPPQIYSLKDFEANFEL
jgi:hypothetical protein